MNSLVLRCLASFFIVVAVGCGGRQNEVIIAPDVDPAVQQKAYDDYDKQNADSAKNYK